MREDSASRNFMVTASVWLVFGVLMGLTLAIEFVFPDLFKGTSWLVFSRLRQAHVNTVMFAWLSGGMMGLMLYIVPRLTARRLYSELLGNICVVLWNIALIWGVIALLVGQSQGREYAELIFPVDVGIMLVLLLNMFNVYMTIAKRVEKKLYVSLWYITGTVIWMPMLYFIGNVMWHPATGGLTGINDSIFNWFYGHNVLGLWFTTGLLAVAYYIVPRETHTPIYSHLVSLFGFWGIAFFYTGVGGHHLLWAPIPYWVKTIAVGDSIGMIIPVAAIMLNFGMTMRGNWNRFSSSIPLRYVFTGIVAYVIVSFQGSHEALRAMNELTHFTQYVGGHAHLSLLFFAASIVIGGMYYAIPRICKCELYSDGIANTQYAIYVVGFTFLFLGFLLTGIVQGTDWVHVGLPVWTVLPGLRPFMALRVVGGALLVISFIMFTYNILATVIKSRPIQGPGALVPSEQERRPR